MKLAEMAASLPESCLAEWISVGNPEIQDVVYDSRNVKPGSLFVAVVGYQTDGHGYIAQAVQAGAVALVVEKEKWSAISDSIAMKKELPVLSVTGSRVALAFLSAAFFSFPWRRLHLVGVTGTNGKTSITYILQHIWEFAGKKTGLVGTIEYRWPGSRIISQNTTPESRDLASLFFMIAESDVSHAAMEVSSHALYLDRTAAFSFRSAIFTNLTQDHLDFHKDMEDYFASKSLLFSDSLLTGNAIINVDDSYGQRLYARLKSAGKLAFSFSLREGAGDYHASSLHYSLLETSFVLHMPQGGKILVHTHLKGKFNVYNISLAMIEANLSGISWEVILRALADPALQVPGRFEVVRASEDSGFVTVVDYAHTPDALENILTAGRDLNPTRLVTVFGCGGDRDRGKRPKMGRIAESISDLVIVTSDNPRTEDPRQILNDIEAGMTLPHETIIDRKEAIIRAVNICQAGDLLVIAGKGHEDYQILGKTKIHFDDREVARAALETRRRS